MWYEIEGKTVEQIHAEWDADNAKIDGGYAELVREELTRLQNTYLAVRFLGWVEDRARPNGEQWSMQFTVLKDNHALDVRARRVLHYGYDTPARLAPLMNNYQRLPGV